jgi:aromatic ring-opening dioxygenase LigB subunit
MSLVFGAICPHPPILIPQIGQENLGKVEKTIQAYLKLEKKLIEAKPDVLIIVSPHTLIDPDQFNILNEKQLAGDFGQFGDQETVLNFRNDLGLVISIKKQAKKNNIPIRLMESNELDHGMLVPLFYLTSGALDNLPIVGMGFSFLPFDIHFQFGKLIGDVAKKTKKRVAIIASGDLSHRLTPDAPTGYSIEGKKFDQKLIELLKKNKIQEILKMDPILIEKAGECGLRSILILLGTLNNFSYKTEILSYEGPFGVGYLTTSFSI